MIRMIRGHCDLVRSKVLTKWVPLARLDPHTGRNTFRLAFVGESLGGYQMWETVYAIDICLQDLWERATLVVDVKGNPAGTVDLNFNGTLVLPASAAAGVSPGTVTVLLTYAKLMYSKDATHWVGQHHDKYELAQPGSPPTMLPLPQGWLLFNGVWDSVRPVRFMGNYSHSVDWFAPSHDGRTWEEALAEHSAYSQANYARPLSALLRTWQSARRDPPGVNGAAWPPNYFIVAINPPFNCSAGFFTPTGDYYNFTIHRRGFTRCSALALGPQQVFRAMQLGTAAEAVTRSRRDPAGQATIVKVLDRSEPLNPCYLLDGQHIDVYDVVCREYSLESFWDLF